MSGLMVVNEILGHNQVRPASFCWRFSGAATRLQAAWLIDPVREQVVATVPPEPPATIAPEGPESPPGPLWAKSLSVQRITLPQVRDPGQS
ncbi:hypothetical protein Sspor_03300 [Streptomyces spororaveus]|uniref:Uncharacterized protein n=1 Tax=Streptomyces spororaveus TaxID=284039 RepID=A0ABQ3T330_9ACTN|nr:hypothetical protein Sspor_03300 [Streptomyces spororaveus]